MMIDTAHIVAAWVVAASSSKSSSSSSFLFLLIPLVVLGYFMLVRPQRQRARQQQAQTRQFTVGDWVMTVGGIAGRVIEANDEWIRIEVASGVQLEVLRQAVSRRLDGDPGTPSGTWGDRWAGDDGDGGADGADDDRHGAGDPDADGHDAPEADGAAGHDETSETQAE
jgi:preprotein translocase subunit YajC